MDEILERAKELLQASAAGTNSLAVADCSDEQWEALLGTNEQVLQRSTQVMAHATLAQAECGDCGTVIVPPPPPPPDPDPDPVIVPNCSNFIYSDYELCYVEQRTGQNSPNVSSIERRVFGSFDKEEKLGGNRVKWTWKGLNMTFNFVSKLFCPHDISVSLLSANWRTNKLEWVPVRDGAISDNVVHTSSGITCDITFYGYTGTKYWPRDKADSPFGFQKVALYVVGMVSQATYDAKVRELNP